MMFTKSQSSVEISAIMAVLLIVLGIIVAVNLDVSSMFVSKYSRDQINLALDDISNGIDLVYFQGNNSKTTVYVTLPSGIKNSSIENGTLLFNIHSDGNSYSQIYRILDYNVTGTLPFEKGSYLIAIESFGGYVNVSYD